MTKLYDIKNFHDLAGIPLYIKDDGTYVLEGPYTLVEVKFNTPGFKAPVLDQLAYLIRTADQPKILPSVGS